MRNGLADHDERSSAVEFLKPSGLKNEIAGCASAASNKLVHIVGILRSSRFLPAGKFPLERMGEMLIPSGNKLQELAIELLNAGETRVL
jgi:hypothetical protein